MEEMHVEEPPAVAKAEALQAPAAEAVVDTTLQSMYKYKYKYIYIHMSMLSAFCSMRIFDR